MPDRHAKYVRVQLGVCLRAGAASDQRSGGKSLMSLSHRIDKDSFVGHLRRILHVEPARLKGTPTRRKEEVDQVMGPVPRYPRKRTAESEQKQLNEAITDGQQQPVADEAGDLAAPRWRS